MKKKSLPAIISSLLLITVFLFVFNACQKGSLGDGANLPPYYNLDVALFPQFAKMGHSDHVSGFIKFRQDPDTARIITLDTWVTGLQPDHAYLLQRAVNPITDSSCSSVAWLTLGLGLVPQAIHTDLRGSGHEQLFRAVTSIARGTQFRIHFQVLDSLTLAPVLSSDCYQYTVR